MRERREFLVVENSGGWSPRVGREARFFEVNLRIESHFQMGEFTDYGICNVCTSLVAETELICLMDLTSKSCEANLISATIPVLGPDNTTMPKRGDRHLSSSWTRNIQ